MALLLAGNIGVWNAVAAEAAHPLRIYVLDVGQGDAIYVEAPNGNSLLLDGGPDRSVLRRLGEIMPWYRRSIDLIALSHPHKDHFEGLIDVVSRYKVGGLVGSGTQTDDPYYRSWREALIQEKVSEVILGKGAVIDLGGGVLLTTLLPREDATHSTPHDGMLVMRLDYGESSILFTGDMEENLESGLAIFEREEIRSDVLKVGHHGSRTSSSEQFLDAVGPAIAVISLGKGNSYGHPHSEVVERLLSRKIEIFRTDSEGTVLLESEGERFVIQK